MECSPVWRGEGSHGLHELIGPGLQQHLAPGRVEAFHPVLGAPVPVRHEEPFPGTQAVHLQIMPRPLKPKRSRGPIVAAGSPQQVAPCPTVDRHVPIGLGLARETYHVFVPPPTMKLGPSFSCARHRGGYRREDPRSSPCSTSQPGLRRRRRSRSGRESPPAPSD